MLILAVVWKIFGFSILSARLTMLAIAAAGVFLSFLLAIRLGRKAEGAPAFAAVAFLMAAPLFYTQSMMVLLDMPAMTLTVLALLLFFDERYAACAAAATALVLVKETAITTPMVFAAWLWFREKRQREALYFLAPALALGLWLVELHHVTGHWLGNDRIRAVQREPIARIRPHHLRDRPPHLHALSQRRPFPGRRGPDRRMAPAARQGMDHRGPGGGGADGGSHAARRRCARSLHAARAADPVYGVRGGRLGLVAVRAAAACRLPW